MKSFHWRLKLTLAFLWTGTKITDAASRDLKSYAPSTPSRSPHVPSHPANLKPGATHPSSPQSVALLSDSPSLVPSITPSKLLSTEAQTLKSDFPSLTPSIFPSSNSLSSDHPSLVPSIFPSTEHKLSDAPSLVPSSPPSNGLLHSKPALSSDIPSLVPSSPPSNGLLHTKPTLSSDIPSDTPSYVPSDLPSSVPSDLPSSVPSVVPSSRPTKRPTLKPTKWYKKPTSRPTRKPTHLPTSKPTKPRRPSYPTFGPSSSGFPSTSLSGPPTVAPSVFLQAAFQSDLPSLVPSTSPSKLLEAQFLPSIAPSKDVSDSPSTSPSAEPSKSPIAAPSEYPTNIPSPSPTYLPVASSIPTVTETIYSALSSFKFTGVTNTMDETITQVFQDTAVVFFEQRVIEPTGFNTTVVSVNVISQSVVGGKTRRQLERNLQDSFLVVTFRIVANVVPGDAPNFNFQQVVDTTFSTYSYDFQYRLQAASPFFAGSSKYSVINSVSNSYTSSAVSYQRPFSTTTTAPITRWGITLALSSVALVMTSCLVTG